ncbi:MAG: TfuA-like protein [Pseudomonadota bacterium]
MIIIFAGPTINEQQILDVVEEATVLPPVEVGDVYRAAQSMPDAIGIIDGYFDSVPSVWHKEILWALDAGIPVYGASSMGALRAAELHAFGMIGVGEIFENYRDGVFEDDDEVALQHGPEELGFASLSEPLVNIRATLRQAVKGRKIEQGLAAELVDLAKSRFYPERTWERLLEDVMDLGGSDLVVERLEQWLVDGRVDQKHADALEMLEIIKRPVVVEQSLLEEEFQHTVMWDQLTRQIDQSFVPTLASVMLDCLRMEQERYQYYRQRAAKLLPCYTAGIFDGRNIPSAKMTQAITRFRADNGLYTATSLKDWLTTNGLDEDGLEARIAEEILLGELIKSHPVEFKRKMLAELKNDKYDEELSASASQVLDSVNRTGLQNTDPESLGLNNIQLQLWFFETCMETPMPDDIEHYLQKNDFSDRREFETMMLYQFIHWSEKQ